MESQTFQRIDPLQDLPDLVLEKDNEKDDQNLPQDLEHPGGQEESPGSGHRKDNAQGQKAYQGLKGLCPAKPEIKVVNHKDKKHDVQHVLNAQIGYDGYKMHFFPFSLIMHGDFLSLSGALRHSVPGEDSTEPLRIIEAPCRIFPSVPEDSLQIRA